MKVSINQLAIATGMTRETINRKLHRARLAYEDGPKGAKLYDSASALDAIYEKRQPAPSLEEQPKPVDARYRKEMVRLELEQLRKEERAIKREINSQCQ